MSQTNQRLILYTDGGARGNPGLAGAGAVITDASGRVLKQSSKSLGILTNNEAEYQAVIFGLATVKRLLGRERLRQNQIEVRLDSELVARQLRGQYQIKEKRLWPLFMKIWNWRVADFPNLEFKHLAREENRLADKLANEAMDVVDASAGNSGLF